MCLDITQVAPFSSRFIRSQSFLRERVENQIKKNLTNYLSRFRLVFLIFKYIIIRKFPEDFFL